MAKKAFGSSHLDSAVILETVSALLLLGEPFQVDASPAKGPTLKSNDMEVEVRWGEDAFRDDR